MRAVLAALLIAGALAQSADAATPKRGLRSFDSCAQLVRYARAQARTVPVLAFAPPIGAIASAPAPGSTADAPVAAAAAGESSAAPTASGTNTQEAGVDEPDLLKAEDRRAFAVTDGRLQTVDLTGPEPRLASSTPLTGFGHRLLLRGDRLLVLAETGAGVTLTELDVADLAAPAVRRTLVVPGGLVDARLTGGTARIVVSTQGAPLPQGAGLRRVVPPTVLRSRVSGRTFRRGLVACDDVRRPVVPGGTALLSVLTFDLDRGLFSVDRDAVLAGAQAVYASPRSLVIATTTPEGDRTALHRFDTTEEGRTTYAASGEVEGAVLNQFSLSEHEGVLRVATTRGTEQSFVTTFRQDGGRLVRLGQVGGLGRGERIYAVRFVADQGYVVTFRQVDPLYVVDLADPTAPKVRGELKILGYSAYLHPIGDDLLLGVGVDATEEGRRTGAQVSVFDVRDPARPRRLHALALGSGSFTPVEVDHRAFLWWGPSKLAVLPVVTQEDSDGAATARLLRAGRSEGLSEAGRIEHADAARGRVSVERSVVAGGRLVTLSSLGLGVHRVQDLVAVGFAGFPAPPAPEPPSDPQPQPRPID